jgi:hypothetical protein
MFDAIGAGRLGAPIADNQAASQTVAQFVVTRSIAVLATICGP